MVSLAICSEDVQSECRRQPTIVEGEVLGNYAKERKERVL